VILDSSAIVAVLLRQPGHEPLLDRLAAAEEVVGVGAPTLSETGIVLAARLGATGKSLLARFVQESGSSVIPFGAEHWGVAVDAFLRFGKGRHRAALNFGDCMTYATARIAAQPLLCLGGDFAKTDIELAV
jgi:ribonuclease VapC